VSANYVVATVRLPVRYSGIDAPPLILLGLVSLVVFVWNSQVGLRWQPTFLVSSSFSLFLAAIAVFYSTVRRERRLAELALYLGLWFLFPIIITRLTYLGATLKYPLHDKQFADFDASLGFDWRAWVFFVSRHSLFRSAQALAYESHFWQPFVAIGLIVWHGPKTRNAEFVTGILVAALVTALVAAFWPAAGPAEALGFHSQQGHVIAQLWNTVRPTFHYIPIVMFPSFHTVMAILFTLVHRGSKWRLIVFGLLNLAMLISIPYWGDHYLSDMLAGAIIALGSFWTTATYYRRFDKA
jgi:membrane-associated phospholipid phosphatase